MPSKTKSVAKPKQKVAVASSPEPVSLPVAPQSTSNFVSNLCNFNVSAADMRELSHNIVNRLLIPELKKCTNKGKETQKRNTKQSIKPKPVIGKRLAEGNSSSPKNPKMTATNGNVVQRKSIERNAAKPGSSQSIRSGAATNEKNEIGTTATMQGAICNFDGQSSVVKSANASQGDVMIEEIVIIFCRNR